MFSHFDDHSKFIVFLKNSTMSSRVVTTNAIAITAFRILTSRFPCSVPPIPFTTSYGEVCAKVNARPRISFVSRTFCVIFAYKSCTPNPNKSTNAEAGCIVMGIIIKRNAKIYIFVRRLIFCNEHIPPSLVIGRGFNLGFFFFIEIFTPFTRIAVKSPLWLMLYHPPLLFSLPIP
jgi:hypothetical protein